MKSLLLTILTISCLQGISQNKIADTLTGKKLDTIAVNNSKPFIQNLVDKTVMNIESRPSIAGQNALELLKSAPGVVVDGNENIQMGGKKGVTILIDGRNTEMSNEDVAQILKSIEANNIKEIEIITNPSAKFDAAGNAGIINIKLKKSIVNGFNGNTTFGLQQSTHARQNANAAFNYRKNKLNWFANMGANKGFQNTIANNDRTAINKTFTQKSIEGDDFWGINTRTGIDYSINKKNTIGFLWMYNSRKTTMNNLGNTNVRGFNTDTNVATQSSAPFANGRNNFNINYTYKNKNQELNVDLDYSGFNSSLYNTVTNDLSSGGNLKFAQNSTQNNADVKIKIAVAKIDYSKKLANNASIEIGAKTVFTQSTNNLQVLNAISNSWLKDTGKTNQFTYTENIQAGYINYTKELRKLTIQTGLRAEYTKVSGQSINLKNQQINNPDTGYLNLFPTIFLQYKLKENHQLNFTFGRRIDRPSYQDQNPFIYALDAFNFEVGNPFLTPQMSNSVELGYTYKYASSIKIKYAQTTNYIEQLTYQNENKTILIPQNAGTRETVNLSISTPLQPTKWWSSYLSAEPYWQKHNTTLNGYGFNQNTTQSSIGFNGYIGNWFTLKNNWKAELSAWYNFQNTTTIYTSKPLGSINIGASKSLLNKQATLKFGITDVLNTQRWQQTANTANLNMLTYRKWESRNVFVSFSYRFGNSKIKAARERSNSNDGEISRIKTKD